MKNGNVSILGWLGWVGVVKGGSDGWIFMYRSFCLIFFVLSTHTKFQPSSSMRLENIPLSKVNRTHDTRHHPCRIIVRAEFYSVADKKRQTYRLSDKHLQTNTYRQTDLQTNRLTDKQTDRQTDWQWQTYLRTYWAYLPWIWTVLLLFFDLQAYLLYFELVSRTDGRTDIRTDGRTDRRTDPLIEMLVRI